MTTDFGEDMNCQFLEILRSLLDSYTLSGAQVPTLTILPSNICFNYLFLNWDFVPILKESLIVFMLFSVSYSTSYLTYRVSLTACVANLSFHVIKLQLYHIAYSWA